MSTPVVLLPEDVEYLDGNYRNDWEIIPEGPGKNVLVIKHFPIPEKYRNEKEATLMILIPSGYPGSALDMFYFYPPLKRVDGIQIHGLAQESHVETLWQRWSRHYRWEPGKDSIVSHVEYVKRQLLSEADQ